MLSVLFGVVAVVVTFRIFKKTGSNWVLLGFLVALSGTALLMWLGLRFPMSSGTTKLATHAIVAYQGGNYRELISKEEIQTHGGETFVDYIQLNYLAKNGSTYVHTIPVAETTRVSTKVDEKARVDDLNHHSVNWLLYPIPVNRKSWVLHIPRSDPAPYYQ